MRNYYKELFYFFYRGSRLDLDDLVFAGKGSSWQRDISLCACIPLIPLSILTPPKGSAETDLTSSFYNSRLQEHGVQNICHQVKY